MPNFISSSSSPNRILRIVILSQIIVTGVADLRNFLPLERAGKLVVDLTLDSQTTINLTAKTNSTSNFKGPRSLPKG